MSDLMQQGWVLLSLGMGTVFTFLIVLTFVTTAMTFIVRRIPQAATPVVSTNASQRSNAVQMEKIAAVAAAAKAIHNR